MEHQRQNPEQAYFVESETTRWVIREHPTAAAPRRTSQRRPES
jgi:hypothetical protein